MFKELQATLYDLFGYLLPGTLGLAGIIIIFGNIAEDTHTYAFQYATSSAALTAAASFVAYVLGHGLHAIGNTDFVSSPRAERVLYGPGWSELFGEDPRHAQPLWVLRQRDAWLSLSRWIAGFTIVPLGSDLTKAIDEDLRLVYGVSSPTHSHSMASAFMDEARLLASREGEREVYWYREGFYRGTTVALLLFVCAICWRVFVGPLTIALSRQLFLTLRTDDLLLVLSLTCFLLVASTRRLHRFSRIRSERALAVLFLVAENKRQGAPPPHHSALKDLVELLHPHKGASS